MRQIDKPLPSTIAEREQTDQALIVNEQRLRFVIEAIPVAIVQVDRAGKILLVNAQTERLFGYRREEIVGEPIERLMPERFHAHHAQYRQDYLSRPIAKAVGAGRDLTGRHKDGREFPVEVGLNMIEVDREQTVLGVIVDISERKRAEAESRRYVEDLERSNREVEQFAYMASHDLQEPLRMVASYLQLLARRYQGRLDAEADEFIRIAVDSAHRMKALIDSLLEYSRAGGKQQDFQTCNCTFLLMEVLTSLRLIIEENGGVVVHEPLPTLMVDGAQLRQVFQNLIGNAIKFRKSACPIVHVTAGRQEESWVFCVRDNGIGVDMKFADRIFSAFQRLHTAKEYPGTGIGLAICKKIVERHGGRIWVESVPGQGSAFYFTLPVNEGGHHGAADRKSVD